MWKNWQTTKNKEVCLGIEKYNEVSAKSGLEYTDMLIAKNNHDARVKNNNNK